METAYVVVHGRKPHHLAEATEAELAQYVSGIAYGEPSVRAISVGDHFVALAEFGHAAQARHTFNRMGSFSYGGCFSPDMKSAVGEFGAWSVHYAPPRRTTPV